MKKYEVYTTGINYNWTGEDAVSAENKKEVRERVNQYFRSWDVKVNDDGFSTYGHGGHRPKIVEIREVE